MASFALDLREFVAKAKDDIDKVVRGAIMGVAKSLIEKSPVGDPSQWDLKFVQVAKAQGWIHDGYVGGRFRGSWDLALDAVPTALYRTIDPDGSVSQDRIEAAIPAQAAGKMYYIANLTPYAMALENGHSYQAPAGMVAVTVVEWQNIVTEAVNKVKGGA